jgi:hypothetical protein
LVLYPATQVVQRLLELQVVQLAMAHSTHEVVLILV